MMSDVNSTTSLHHTPPHSTTLHHKNPGGMVPILLLALIFCLTSTEFGVCDKMSNNKGINWISYCILTFDLVLKRSLHDFLLIWVIHQICIGVKTAPRGRKMQHFSNTLKTSIKHTRIKLYCIP
jgi:hypothetical protein